MGIEQKFTGDANQLIAEIGRLRKENVKLDEQLAKTAKSNKEFHDQNKDFVREGVQLSKQLSREAETHEQKNQRLKESLKAAWQAGRIGADEYQASLKHIEAAAGKIDSGLVRTASRFRDQVIGAVTLSRAMSVASQAVQHISEKERNRGTAALQTTNTVAGSQAKVIKNLGGVDDDTARKFLGDIEQVRADVKFQSVIPLNEAAASLLSATKGSRELTLSLLKDTAPLFRDAPQQMADFAGVAADTIALTGAKSSKSAISALLGIQGQMRPTQLSDLSSFTEALSATIASNHGVSDKERLLRESGAMFAALSGVAPDTTGDRTKTAIASFASKAGGLSPGGLFEDIEALRKLPKDANELRKLPKDKQATTITQEDFFSSGFDAARKDVMRTILDPESLLSKTTLQAFESIKPDGGLLDTTKAQLLGLTKELRAASADAAVEGQIELTKRRSGAERAAQIRKITTESLDNANGGFGALIDDWFRLPFADATNAFSRPENAINILRTRRNALVESDDFNYAVGLSETGKDFRPAINTLNEGIRQLLDIQKEMLEETKQKNRGSSMSQPNVRMQTRSQEMNDN